MSYREMVINLIKLLIVAVSAYICLWVGITTGPMIL